MSGLKGGNRLLVQNFISGEKLLKTFLNFLRPVPVQNFILCEHMNVQWQKTLEQTKKSWTGNKKVLDSAKWRERDRTVGKCVRNFRRDEESSHLDRLVRMFFVPSYTIHLKRSWGVLNFFVTRRLSRTFVSLIRPTKVRDIFVTEQWMFTRNKVRTWGIKMTHKEKSMLIKVRKERLSWTVEQVKAPLCSLLCRLHGTTLFQ